MEESSKSVNRAQARHRVLLHVSVAMEVDGGQLRGHVLKSFAHFLRERDIQEAEVAVGGAPQPREELGVGGEIRRGRGHREGIDERPA